MVVVQILPALNNGGVERGTVEIANFLAESGHTSIIISAGGLMQSKLSASVKHIKLAVGKKSLTSLLLIKQLALLFVKNKVDIVHARSRLPAWLAFKAIAKLNTNKPQFITTIHGLYSVKKYSSIMARGDKVIAVSKTAADYVTKNYPRYLKSKPHVIYRGINTNEFPYDHQPDLLWLQKWYEKHHQLVGYKTVMLPGRLTSLKGAKDLLPWLHSKDNDAKLMLTANPENDIYAAKLYHWFKEKGVDHRIVWVGLQDSMANLYAVSDVVLSTSVRPESFGRTVIEALAIGTPVVGYNHGGVGEILTDIFPQGKVELNNQVQLSDKINGILKLKPLVNNSQPYLLDNMLSQTLTLYHEAANV